MRSPGDDSGKFALTDLHVSDSGDTTGLAALSEKRLGIFTKRTKHSHHELNSDLAIEQEASTSSLPQRQDAVTSLFTKWRVFSPAAYTEAPDWEVPWGWETIVCGLLGWSAALVVIAVLAVAGAVVFLHGLTIEASKDPVKATSILLFLQVALTAVSVGLVKLIASCKRDRLPDDFLRVSLSDPFLPPYGWATWAGIGMVAAPAVCYAASLTVHLLPQSFRSGGGTVDSLSGIVHSGDPLVFFMLFLIGGVLAPIQEETFFRGFLMTSLTKYMPMPAAAAVSSVVFAAYHLNVRDSIGLWALGLVLGLAYGRSRNLLTSMIIHGVWNSFIFTFLFFWLRSGHTFADLHDT